MREHAVEAGRLSVLVAAHRVRLSMRKDDDIAGLHPDTAHVTLDEALSLHQDVKQRDVLRLRHDDSGEQVRVRRLKGPRRRKLCRKEDGSAQTYGPQNI